MPPGEDCFEYSVLGVPEARKPSYPSAFGKDDLVMVGPANGFHDPRND